VRADGVTLWCARKRLWHARAAAKFPWPANEKLRLIYAELGLLCQNGADDVPSMRWCWSRAVGKPEVLRPRDENGWKL